MTNQNQTPKSLPLRLVTLEVTVEQTYRLYWEDIVEHISPELAEKAKNSQDPLKELKDTLTSGDLEAIAENVCFNEEEESSFPDESYLLDESFVVKAKLKRSK